LASVSLFANRRAQRSGICDPLDGKHKAESGHLDSAVNIAAMPLKQWSPECLPNA
jgi:hypothetical protein